MDYRLKNRYAIQLSSAFIPIVRMGILSGFLGTMIIGSYLALDGSIAVGSYSVMVFLTQRFLWPFTTLGETVDLFERSMASTKRILDLLDTEHKIKDKQGAITLNNFNQDITFSQILLFRESWKSGIDDNTSPFRRRLSGAPSTATTPSGLGTRIFLKKLSKYNVYNFVDVAAHVQVV